MFSFSVKKGVYTIYLNKKIVTTFKKGFSKPLNCLNKKKYAVLEWAQGKPFRVIITNLSTGNRTSQYL